jgi:erythromycin 3''-O-methyltransferase
MPADCSRNDESALLHQGSRSAAWGSLGLWPEAGSDTGYADACAALARRTGLASGLQPGERVLSVACGSGEELLLWLREFGVAEAWGVDAAPERVALARRRLAVRAPQALGSRALLGSGTALLALGLPEQGFDRVVCVDAAYHLHPRSAFLAAAWRLLRPGGRLAYTDLVVEPLPHAGARGALLAAAAQACGLAPDGLAGPAAQCERLSSLGFVDPRLERLDAAVLGGFADFVRRQGRTLGRHRLRPAWLRPALTAALIPPCRAAGLGYALLSACRPPMSSATTQADRTALSSKGTPGWA